ncbi:putative endosulphine [Helianthus annuus]|nr:putative endosulphine [Helianthus annuus]
MAGYERNEELISRNGHKHEGMAMGDKYGGLVPKKKPLISKASKSTIYTKINQNWALCKQGAGINEKSTIDIETLQPKLERTPRQHLPPRRPACISGGNNHVE